MNRAQLLINEAEAETLAYANTLNARVYEVRSFQVGALEGTVRQLCAEIECLTEPAKRDPSLIYARVDHSDLGRVWLGFDYTPETRDTWEEPGDREDCDVCEVWMAGRNIIDALSPGLVSRIDDIALEAVRASIADAEAEARMEAAL